ncbi:MAG: hypothetical protein P3M72_00035 [Candidatus Hodgkinia cicadicola]|nr:MAG: hypothetical protein P3M72_00035 [Candidatus Hodgkinia cicadicola]
MFFSPPPSLFDLFVASLESEAVFRLGGGWSNKSQLCNCKGLKTLLVVLACCSVDWFGTVFVLPATSLVLA